MKSKREPSFIFPVLIVVIAIFVAYIVLHFNQKAGSGTRKKSTPVKVETSQKPEKSFSRFSPGPSAVPVPHIPHTPSPPIEKEFAETKFYTENFEPTGVYSSIWAYDKNNVFICGMNGILLKFDGKIIVQYKHDFSGWIFRIDGRSPNEVYASGQQGVVLKFEGEKWEKFKQFTEKIRLISLWVSRNEGSSDIFTGGDYGILYHYNGKSWKKMKTGVKSRIWSIWGTSPKNIFAATYKMGKILHYNGKVWKEILVTGYKHHYFYSVFGFSEKDIYIGGDTGLVLHYDGKNFREIKYCKPSNKGNFIISIKGSSPDNLFFCDYYGKIVHWNGSRGSVVETQKGQNCFFDICPINKALCFAVGDGGIIKCFNGKEWKRLAYGNPKKLQKKDSSHKRVEIIKNINIPIVCFEKQKWFPLKKMKTSDLVGIWGTSRDNVFAVGNMGNIYHYDGVEWKKQDSPVEASLYCVRGASPQAVFACGVDGVILKYDGKKWAKMKSGVTTSISSLWFASPDCGYAVGFEGVILKYDGNTWKQMVSPKDIKYVNFSDVWGFDENDVYAVGDLGTIYHYDGKEWKIIPTKTVKWLLSAWGADRENLYIGAEDGLILHYDGKNLTEMDAGTITCIFGLWGSSNSDIYGIAGDGGAVVHFNGKEWSQVAAAEGYLCNIWGVDENLFYIVGKGR